MADKAKEKEQLSDEVISICKKMETSLTQDANTGSITEKDDHHVYKDCLPDGLNLDIARQVSNYNANFVAAGAFVFGKLAVELMAGNKKLDSCEGHLKMAGRDKVDYTVNRSKTYQNRLVPGSETITKMGVVSPTLNIKAGNKSAGQLRIARDMVSELAMQKLKK